MVYFAILSFFVSIYYYSRVINEPLHPDSGEFIYPGIMQQLGFKKEYLQHNVDGKYKPTSLSYNVFPPEPHSNISNKKQYIGAFPYFRDKMFVWWFFEKFYYLFPLKTKSFRLINIFLIFLISQLFFIIIHDFLGLYYSIFWSMIFQLTVMLPHFDFYQIHAEEWGTLLLIVLSILLTKLHYLFISPILFGLILIAIFFYIKITFAPTLLYFFLSPIVIFQNLEFFRISTISILVGLITLFLFYLFSGLLKPVFWSLNPFHLIKYKKSAGTSRTDDQRSTDFSIKKFIMSYFIEILIGLLALAVTIQWLFYNSEPMKIEIFLFGWICVICIEVFVQGKLYPSHLLPLTIPGILFIGLQNNLFSLIISILVFILWSKFFFLSGESILSKYGKQSQNPYIDLMAQYDEVAKSIRQNTTKKDTILSIGYSSPLYTLSKRKAALGLYEALTTIDPFDLQKKLGDNWEWWLLQAIIVERPKLLVDSNSHVDSQELCNSLGISMKVINSIDTYAIYKIDYKNMEKHPTNLGENIFTYKTGDRKCLFYIS